MYVRQVTINLKPNTQSKFTDSLEKQIIPLLRTQHGFKDEVAFVAPGGNQAVSISFWDRKEDAETYERGTYPQVLKALSDIADGAPSVKPYEVSNSTWHKIAAAA